MKMQEHTALKNLSMAVIVAAIGVFASEAGASGRYGAGGDAQLIYHSRSAHRAIHGYPSSTPAEISQRPELIYVSQAYGPAIHGYEHAGSEKAVPWNVEYVDTAYGQAIYSYERSQVSGEARVLPITVD